MQSRCNMAFWTFAVIGIMGICGVGRAQDNPPTPSQNQNTASATPIGTPYVLHVTSREVVVDVVATDAVGGPITDLQPEDLEVIDRAPDIDPASQTISSLLVVDPAVGGGDPEAGFHVAAYESCLQQNSVHYELAYHPGPYGSIPGYHTVFIQSKRGNVDLFYRHGYYIGDPSMPEKPPVTSAAGIVEELHVDACSHPLAPLSLSLQAVPITSGTTGTIRYRVNVDSGSLTFLPSSDDASKLQLDYGACNFDAAGQPINFLSAATDQVLSPDEHDEVEANGFHHIFEFTRPKGVAMTRFVVRDRTSGNLGLTDVTFPWPQGSPGPDPALLAEAREIEQSDAQRSGGLPTPMGPIGSFGSVVPRPHSFCGDVFELQPDTAQLPDFRTLEPIGSIYTESLLVPDQIFIGTNGIPGVTDRTTWFGVDYRGTFWIRTPGKYEFKLTSDDGAILQIDDQRVIDMNGLHPAHTQTAEIALTSGRHIIHVPYYEGMPYSVALVLWIRPPDGDWKIFDLREFAEPHDTSNQPSAN